MPLLSTKLRLDTPRAPSSSRRRFGTSIPRRRAGRRLVASARVVETKRKATYSKEVLQWKWKKSGMKQLSDEAIKEGAAGAVGSPWSPTAAVVHFDEQIQEMTAGFAGLEKGRS